VGYHMRAMEERVRNVSTIPVHRFFMRVVRVIRAARGGC
jgi:hypothetical protein